ncbi:MAG: phosphoribosylglycinamide formyltransferase [Luteitalea sp.]|nr:phosphoribosylglycinamide formyltransferase [Luteitalea sp.]
MAKRLGVLISGRGSNLQAIIDATVDGRLDAVVQVVVSNRPHVQGLDRARVAGIETVVVDHTTFGSRAAFDRALVAVLESHNVDLVCLAGFMRLLGPEFISAFPNAVLNIHPSLLPAFAGLDAQLQAWEHGVKTSGVTVHFVTQDLDAGPIVLQAAVPVRDDDTPETLAARILVEEHRVYPEAVARVLRGGWRMDGRRFIPGP